MENVTTKMAYIRIRWVWGYPLFQKLQAWRCHVWSSSAARWWWPGYWCRGWPWPKAACWSTPWPAHLGGGCEGDGNGWKIRLQIELWMGRSSKSLEGFEWFSLAIAMFNYWRAVTVAYHSYMMYRARFGGNFHCSRSATLVEWLAVWLFWFLVPQDVNMPFVWDRPWNGGFHSHGGYLQIVLFFMEHSIKMDELGVLLFSETFIWGTYIHYSYWSAAVRMAPPSWKGAHRLMLATGAFLSGEPHPPNVALNGTKSQTCPGWWFGTFFIFPYIGNNHPNWLIFFIGVQTTNQMSFYPVHAPWSCESVRSKESGIYGIKNPLQEGKPGLPGLMSTPRTQDYQVEVIFRSWLIVV